MWENREPVKSVCNSQRPETDSNQVHPTYKSEDLRTESNLTFFVIQTFHTTSKASQQAMTPQTASSDAR